MGGVVGSIIGGVASSSSSKKAARINAQAQADNRAFATQMYDKGVALYQPEITSGNAASGYINGLLGLGDSAAADDAFSKYRDTSGYQFTLDQGLDSVMANAAAKGAFQSGATAKALQARGMNIADTTKNNYITQLTDVANRGVAGKSSVVGQGTNLTNTVVNANNSQAQSSAQNAINQGSIINKTLENIGSSFSGGGPLSTLFGI